MVAGSNRDCPEHQGRKVSETSSVGLFHTVPTLPPAKLVPVLVDGGSCCSRALQARGRTTLSVHNQLHIKKLFLITSVPGFANAIPALFCFKTR